MNDETLLSGITRSIRKFLFDNYLFGYTENDFSNDASFLEYGVLDSLGILELITFIEKEYAIAVTDDEILPDNLDSVSCVGRFVLNKMRVSGTGGADR